MPCGSIEAGFYSDVDECLPVNPATWVQFPAGAGGNIFTLQHYDKMSNSAAAHLGLHYLIMSLSSY